MQRVSAATSLGSVSPPVHGDDERVAFLRRSRAMPSLVTRAWDEKGCIKKEDETRRIVDGGLRVTALGAVCREGGWKSSYRVKDVYVWACVGDRVYVSVVCGTYRA